ncbi:MAG: symmetrical bis(5'-nucleosyl)-tetraphosphatase [Porticoccaceae bacterium]
MAVYAVGDIQGCLDPLKRLLDQASFDPQCDRLLSVGDVVNRGPDSLNTLRFVKNLGDSFQMVLGNHDLHLLAVAAGVRPPTRKDTLNEILNAPDRDELLHWLQQQPLLFKIDDYLLVHAGIPPQWSASEALALAAEVETVLRQDSQALLHTMYGDGPNWNAELTGSERWRAIINSLTRMRFSSVDGQLDLTTKTSPDHPPAGMKPWYAHGQRKTQSTPIIFGHWAALQGRDCGENIFPLDTGCVWGEQMRLFNLDTRQYQHIDCQAVSD